MLRCGWAHRMPGRSGWFVSGETIRVELAPVYQRLRELRRIGKWMPGRARFGNRNAARPADLEIDIIGACLSQVERDNADLRPGS
ncbi:MAG: hypothetical protein ABFD89_17600 [Bryobacteraceae bacterium]